MIPPVGGDVGGDVTYSDYDGREHFIRSLISLINNISYYVVHDYHVRAYSCCKILFRLSSGVLTDKERKEVLKSEKVLTKLYDDYVLLSRSYDVVVKSQASSSRDLFVAGVLDHLGLVCDFLHAHKLLLPIWQDSGVSADSIDFGRLDSEAGK